MRLKVRERQLRASGVIVLFHGKGKVASPHPLFIPSARLVPVQACAPVQCCVMGSPWRPGLSVSLLSYGFSKALVSRVCGNPWVCLSSNCLCGGPNAYEALKPLPDLKRKPSSPPPPPAGVNNYSEHLTGLLRTSPSLWIEARGDRCWHCHWLPHTVSSIVHALER